MSQFATLARTLFRVNFSPKRILGSSYSDSKLKRILVGFALLYVLVAYMGGIGFLFYDLARTLASADLVAVLLMYMYLYAFGTAVMLVFFRADAALFRLADFDILGPLPIKPRTLVAAKALVLMTNVYVMTLFVTAPIAFSYFAFAPTSVAGALLFLPTFLAVPLLPAVLAALFSFSVRLLTERLPKSRMINTVLMFAVFIGLMVSSFSFSAAGENPLLNQQGFIAGLGEMFPPMGWFAAAVHEGDVLSALFLVLSGVAVFAAFVLVLSRKILKTNARAKNERWSARRKTVDYRGTTAFRTLLGKEWRTFVGVPMYIFNAGFGPVILLVAAVASLFFADKVLALFTDLAEGAELPTPFLVLGFVGFCVGMVYTSAVSLSIEGKKLWIVKSLPVAPPTVMDAKLAFNVLLGSLPAAVALPLFAIGFGIPFLDAAAMLCAVFGFSLLTSAVGSIVNLRFPKFSFHNEVEVVKQSLAALIGVFGGFGVIAAEGFALYGLSRIMPWQAGLLVLGIVSAAAAYGVRLRVIRLAENLFIKLGA